MNTTQKRTAFLVVAIVVVVLGALYVRHMKKVTDRETDAITNVPSGPVYSTDVSGYSLSLKRDGLEIQKLSLGEDAVAGMNLLEGSTVGTKAFLTGTDVNFDGYSDVAMLIGIGYGGVNEFYDYYIFNPSTERLERDSVLVEMGNPVFDAVKRIITTNAKDAQDSFTTVYTFNGLKYVKGPVISDATGTIQTED